MQDTRRTAARSAFTGHQSSAQNTARETAPQTEPGASETMQQQTPPSQNQAQQQDQPQNRSAFQESSVIPGHFKPLPEEDLVEWVAPSRPFKERDRTFFVTVITIVLLISMILFFAGQVLPIAVVIAVAFLSYVLSVIPPEDVTYKITTYGIHIEDELYYWDELGRFWFEDKYEQRLLKIEVARFPNRLTIPLGQQDESVLTELLSEVLLKEKPKDTPIDKAANWIQEKIPLEG